MLTGVLLEKGILVVAALVGMAICSAGIGQVAARGQWMHPLAIVGYVLGVAALAVVGAGVIGIQLPLIDTPRAALIALAIIVIAKVALTQAHRALA
jgi:hypothetical protein